MSDVAARKAHFGFPQLKLTGFIRLKRVSILIFLTESLQGQNFVRTLHLDFSENPVFALNSFKINEIKHEKG